MPLRFLNETTPETILEFQAAAEDRYWEAVSLLTEGQLSGGVYLIGYVAEMLLKAAYFAFCGEKLTAELGPLLAPAWNTGCDYFPASYSKKGRDYHDLDFWARLLRAERRWHRGTFLPTHLELEYLSHTRLLYTIWWAEMRYRHAQASPQDALNALAAADWLRQHYVTLSSP